MTFTESNLASNLSRGGLTAMADDGDVEGHASRAPVPSESCPDEERSTDGDPATALAENQSKGATPPTAPERRPSARAEVASAASTSEVSTSSDDSDSLCSSSLPHVGLQFLPEQVLDTLMRKLPFASISRLGGTCRSLRLAATSVLRNELRGLVPRVEGMMETLEASISAQVAAGACLVPIMLRIMLHTLLRLLLGEARVLRAVFWRYVRGEEDVTGGVGSQRAGRGQSQGHDQTQRPDQGQGRRRWEADGSAAPVLCFPAGELLDEMERLLDLVAANGFTNDLEPEVASSLFMRCERFLDFFDSSLEPLLPVQTPFGVKLMDLLGACDTADCALSVLHGPPDRPYMASMRFELRDASAVDSPPAFDGQLPAPVRLRMLSRYLRNNVRWSNFFRPMRELWDLQGARLSQDELENRWDMHVGAGAERRSIERHHHLHQAVIDSVRARLGRGGVAPLPRSLASSSSPQLGRPKPLQRETYEQVMLRAEPPLWRETFTRRTNPPARSVRMGLCCDLELSGADKGLLPLDLEFLDEQRLRCATRHPGLTPQTSATEAEPSPADAGPSGASQSSLTAAAALPSLPLPKRARGDAAFDWGPWFRVRLAHPPAEGDSALLPAGPWEDCGASVRDGCAYGFRGEVHVTFPPRALSSIVTQTVISVRDTEKETSLSSDRRFI